MQPNQSDKDLKKSILQAGLAILDNGNNISQERLMSLGVRGSKERISMLRDELISEGLLPPKKMICSKIPEKSNKDLKNEILLVGQKILNCGETITSILLRKHGIRGAKDRILRAYDELIREGKLPARKHHCMTNTKSTPGPSTIIIYTKKTITPTQQAIIDYNRAWNNIKSKQHMRIKQY